MGVPRVLLLLLSTTTVTNTTPTTTTIELSTYVSTIHSFLTFIWHLDGCLGVV